MRPPMVELNGTPLRLLAISREADVGAKTPDALMIESEEIGRGAAVTEADVLLERADRPALEERKAAGAPKLELRRDVLTA